MTRQLLFPGLGIELAIDRIAFSIGPITVYWYGIIVVSGMMAAVLYCIRRSRQYGLHPDKILDVAIYCVVAGLVSARIYYVVFQWNYYKDHLNEVFRIWEGGIAIYGGLIGGFLMGIVLCRIWKTSALALADLACPSLLIGQSIGRWGNFINIEAFGSNTSLPWGMTGPSIVAYLQSQQASLASMGVMIDPLMPVHPTFFYESAWNLLGFLFLAWYSTRRKYQGEIALSYVFWYGLGRSWIEGLRTDSLMLNNIRVSQMVAVICVIVAGTLLITFHQKWKKGTLPNFMVLPTMEERLAKAAAMAPKSKGEKPVITVEDTEETAIDKEE